MPRPRRILFLTGRLRNGGSEHVLLQHALALDRARFTPAILAIEPNTANRERYLAAGIPVGGPPAGGGGRLQVLRFLRLLRQWCASGRVDLVHAWITITAVLGPLVSRAGTGVPVVTSQRNLGDWLDPLQRRIYRWSNARYVDAMIVNSEAIRRRVLEERLCPPDRIRVVPNGVDVAHFRPAGDRDHLRRDLGLPTGVPLLGMMGRLKPLKGQQDLLAALGLLGREGVTFHAVVVGEGPDRAALEDLARAQGLQGRVQFLGLQEGLPALYAACDVCALCSRSEGLPNVLLEAMASGCAVVSTPVGGVPEVLRDGVEGFHYPAGDVDALAAALRRLLGEPTLRADMGRAGRKRVVSRFGWDAMQRAMESVYDAVLEGGGVLVGPRAAHGDDRYRGGQHVGPPRDARL